MISELFLHLICRRVEHGGFTLEYPDRRTRTYGGPMRNPIYVRITTKAVLQAVLANPSLGLGDGYTSGEIVIAPEQIPALFNLVWANMPAINRLRRRVGFLHRAMPSNARTHQQENIQSHYDIRNGYYGLFLGETMQYSCGFFVRPEFNLDDAQQYKIHAVLAKAGVEPGVKILDMGCGWGDLGLGAAQLGAWVVGATLSPAQERYATAAAEMRGINGDGPGRVRFLQANYQDPVLEQLGPFDAVVSVGMFEHVGLEDQRRFFETVQQLLAPGGRLVLHTITKPERAPTDEWIGKRIFPGGNVPVVSDIVANAAAAGLWFVHYEDFYESYVTTLESWFKAHLMHREEIIRITDQAKSHTGLTGEEFWRQRLMYLDASRSAFEHGGLGLGQFVFTNGKPPRGTLKGHTSVELAKRLRELQHV